MEDLPQDSFECFMLYYFNQNNYFLNHFEDADLINTIFFCDPHLFYLTDKVHYMNCILYYRINESPAGMRGAILKTLLIVIIIQQSILSLKCYSVDISTIIFNI